MKFLRKLPLAGTAGEIPKGMQWDFPYAVYRVAPQYTGEIPEVWRWHKAVAVFYVEQGSLELNTMTGKICIPEESGAFLNPGVIYRCGAVKFTGSLVFVVQFFETAFLCGQYGGRIEQKYILPLLNAAQAGVIGLYSEYPEHRPLLDLLCSTVHLCETDFAYEVRLRALLSELWCKLLLLSKQMRAENEIPIQITRRIKGMLCYIRENISAKISVSEIASAVGLSERECFSLFHDYLRITPLHCLREYRVRNACQLLTESNLPICEIREECGFSGTAYFGKMFYEVMHCSPEEFRKRWQDPILRK